MWISMWESTPNSYPIWIYPKKKPIKPWNGEYCKILTSLTGEEIEKIKAGDVVYLEPKPVKENFTASIGGQFSTDILVRWDFSCPRRAAWE